MTAFILSPEEKSVFKNLRIALKSGRCGGGIRNASCDSGRYGNDDELSIAVEAKFEGFKSDRLYCKPIPSSSQCHSCGMY